nr:CoA-binding protein [Neptuniibacter halophilus]
MIIELLQRCRTIALVGASNRPERASYRVLGFLLESGYQVIPVNPMLAGQEIYGQTVVATLEEIGQPVDLVDIFRQSEAAGDTVDEAIRIGAGAVWLQLGVINPEAKARAQAAGLQVVMDRCPKIEIPRLEIATPADQAAVVVP